MNAGRGIMLEVSETVQAPFAPDLVSPGGLHNRPRPHTPHDTQQVKPDFAFQSDDDGAHLGLNVWRSPSGLGMFYYRDVNGYRVTAGLPRAVSADLHALHEEFSADCRCEGLRVLHFGLTDVALEFLPEVSSDDRPMRCARWHVGDLPVFNLARWREDATVPASIRAQTRRAHKRGVTITHWPTKLFNPVRGEKLFDARDAWLRAKPLPPLVFMTTPYLFEPWPEHGVFVAEVQGEIVGFLVGSRALFGNVFRVDTVARVPGAPNGTAELLVYEAFRAASGRGIQRGTLGLAPLSQRSKVRNKGWLGAVSWCARRFGGGMYSFAGLEAFKAKFEPDVWVPLYAVAPGRSLAPRDVLAVARVFVGGAMRPYVSAALRRMFNRSRG